MSYDNGEPSVKISPVKEMISPGFWTRPPEIINGQIIRPGSRDVMERCWIQRHFFRRVISGFVVPWGTTVHEGIVLDSKYNVIPEAGESFSKGEIEVSLKVVNDALVSKKLPVYRGTSLLLKRRASDNYARFLIDILPIVLLSRDLIGDVDRYIIHRVSVPMQDVILRWLRALGIKPDMIVMTDYDEPVHCERLAFITGLSRHGQYVSPLALHAASLLAIGSVPGHHKKLFVRRGTPRKGRALLNEIEIDERLAREGFLSIDPSEMTAEEQINIFRGAEIIIAVAGAAMANIAFCRPDTKVMALVPGSFPDTLLWFICQHCRLDYTEIRGEQINDEGEGWTDGFNVGLDVIERILTELMPPEQCLERTLASPVSEAVSLQEGEDWHSFASRSP